MEFFEYPDRDMAAMRIADLLAGKLRELLMNRESVSLAVPGGTTPGPIFDVLSAADVDWDRVTIMLTDERWVEPDSPRSNAGLIAARLLQGPAAAARFQPFYKHGMTAEEAAKKSGYSLSAFYSLNRDFKKRLKKNKDPFFKEPELGRRPKDESGETNSVIISLRKKYFSTPDIKSVMDALGYDVSERHIYDL